MSSNRIGKYECFMRATGNQNTKGWYSGDGMTYLYLPDDPEQYFQYRLPGTTVDLIERDEVESLQPVYGHRPEAVDSARAGGVVQEDIRSSAMMQLLGGASALRAKKSWFMFDKEIVCLGADICLNDEREVITTIENRRFKHRLFVNTNGVTTSSYSSARQQKVDKVSWAHLESVAGYWLPYTSDMYVNHNGDATEMWLSHGIAPDKASYAYVILPGMTLDQTSSYAQSPETQILRNDTMVQAVSKPQEGITGVNFWGEASLPLNDSCAIHSDGVAAVMIHEKADTMLISIADPTWERRRQVLEIDGYFQQADSVADKDISLSIADNKTVVSINQLRRLGTTKTIMLVPLHVQNMTKAEIKAALKKKKTKNPSSPKGERR